MMRVVSVAALLAAVACPAMADELYRQDPQQIFSGPASQDARNPGGLGFFAETADNFAAQNGWTINSVEFWGGYPQVLPGHTHGFTVRVYADNGGAIGTQLFMQDVMTFSEVPFYTHPSLGWPGYHYNVNLAPGFAVPAEGRYWVSVVALLDRGGTADEPQWGWVQSTGGSAPSAQQWFFSPGNFAPISGEMAFVLNGTTGSTPACYANCDGSSTQPILNVLDFVCFQTAYAQGASTANCDNSTTEPVLNVLDFICFQTAYAQGCP